ncbi:MAG: pilus assembly protein PilM [Endomicrobia bacterium]|nr:pilus assembly protein PilM [Endomicrobiia bacterium]
MIGLDMGSKFIKACNVVPKTDGSYTVYAAMVSADARDDKKDNPAAFKDSINLLVRQLKSKYMDTVLSVGGIDLLARDFTLPKISKENIAGAVMIEAENSIFETLDEMYSDYQVLSSPSADKIDVLFIAAPKKKVNQMMNNLSLTSLNVIGVGADNVAMTSAYINFNERRSGMESVVLVNIGNEVSNIAIIDHGNLCFVRNVAFGGKDVTAEIGSVYEVDIDTAEQIKRDPAIWNSIGLNIKSILKKSSSNLLEAIFRSMEYCVSRQKIGKVDRIVLTGGGAILKGIDGFIFDILGITTDKWNPLASDKIRSNVNNDLGFMATVSLGLALQKGDTVHV